MNRKSAFDDWFARHLDEDPTEVHKLLSDQTATRFLIAWSLFETSCHNGFLKKADIEPFAQRLVVQESLDIEPLLDDARYFHARYQSAERLRNLMHVPAVWFPVPSTHVLDCTEL